MIRGRAIVTALGSSIFNQRSAATMQRRRSGDYLSIPFPDTYAEFVSLNPETHLISAEILEIKVSK